MGDWLEDGLIGGDDAMTVTTQLNDGHGGHVVTVTMTSDDDHNDSHMTPDFVTVTFEQGLYTYAEIAERLGPETKANTIAARWWPNKIGPAFAGLDCPELRQEVSRSGAGNPVFKFTAFGAGVIADYKSRVIDGGLAYDAWLLEIKNQYPAAIATPVEILDAEIGDIGLDEARGLVLYQQEAQKISRLQSDQIAEETRGELADLLSLFDEVDAANDVDFQLELKAAYTTGAKQAVLLEKARLSGKAEMTQQIKQRKQQ